jgi:hypothetical protein
LLEERQAPWGAPAAPPPEGLRLACQHRPCEQPVAASEPSEGNTRGSRAYCGSRPTAWSGGPERGRLIRTDSLQLSVEYPEASRDVSRPRLRRFWSQESLRRPASSSCCLGTHRSSTPHPDGFAWRPRQTARGSAPRCRAHGSFAAAPQASARPRSSESEALPLPSLHVAAPGAPHAQQ